jgi:hypothetical protein
MKDTDWLLVSVSTAGASASLRVTVWRKLKQLGALYLHQSICVLPARASTRRAISALTERVNQGGGKIRTLNIQITDPAHQASVRQELQAARDDEYNEVLQRFPSFFHELENETARGRTTFEELEESEADLTRFRAWLNKIEARDYFNAPLGDQARTQLARADHALAAFADLAIASHDSTTTDQNTTTSRLRALPQSRTRG